MKTLRIFIYVLATAAILNMRPIANAQNQAANLSLADSLRLLEAAQMEAESRNYRLSFAIVDIRGDLIASVRMAGAEPNTMDTAIGTAMVSAFFGGPSAARIPLATTPITVALDESTGGRFRVLQGALPIVRNGFRVGAMGAGGASPQQNEEIVKIAMAKVGS